MNVISIGYGRHLFDAENIERSRMEICAKAVGAYDMVIFTNESDSLETVYTDTGLTLHPTNSKTKVGMIVDAFLIVRRLVKQSSSSVTVTTQDPFETGAIGLVVKWLYGPYLTVQEHGGVYNSKYWKDESLTNFFRYYIGIFVLKRADTVRVVSETILQTLSGRYIEKNKITKLPVAIDVDKYVNTQPNDQLRNLFPSETFVFLTVARFVEQKNLTLLIKAFSESYSNNHSLRLVVVGSGSDELKIKKLLNKLFSEDCPVKLIDWSDNVPVLMASADAYVLSSNYEGWARVLIEAVCCNLPIVTTNVGCAGEVIENGKYGLVVPINNLQALGHAIDVISADNDIYSELKDNLQNLSKRNLPGADINGYGELWVRSLHCAD